MLATLVTLLVVRGDGDSGRVSAGSTTSAPATTTTSSSTTTSVLSSTTTVVVTTTAPATTAAPPSTGPAPIVTGDGAVLRAPSTADSRVVAAGGPCAALADPGWDTTCGTAAARGATLAWLIETKAASGTTQRRALVFRQTAANRWNLVLQAEDTTGSRFSAIRTRVADVSGDGAEEIAFGFTSGSTTPSLAVDLVEGPGSVVVHRDLPRGAARVSTGQMNTWRQGTGGQMIHDVIQFRSGAWRVVASSTEPAADTPPSQL